MKKDKRYAACVLKHVYRVDRKEPPQRHHIPWNLRSTNKRKQGRVSKTSQQGCKTNGVAWRQTKKNPMRCFLVEVWRTNTTKTIGGHHICNKWQLYANTHPLLLFMNIVLSIASGNFFQAFFPLFVTGSANVNFRRRCLLVQSANSILEHGQQSDHPHGHRHG